MRKLILAVLGCCLLIPESVQAQYDFGDIISFTRRCPYIPGLTYKHFAIYVDNYPGLEHGDHDIFQRTNLEKAEGQGDPKTDCIFDDLSKEKAKDTIEEKKDNYLEEHGIQKGTDAEIVARIQEKLHNCGRYNLLCRNCEHLATYVRYGISISIQEGASGETACRFKQRVCEGIGRFLGVLRQSYDAMRRCLRARKR